MGLFQEAIDSQGYNPIRPIRGEFWFKPPNPNVLVQSKTTKLHLANGKNGTNLDIGVETAPAYDIENRLNEDCPMIFPLGKGRLLTAVHDGASSRKPIEGLVPFNVKGAYYVSHLASLQFPRSKECRELAYTPNITAGDVMRKVNTWLNQELSKVPGVDYNDVLSIPGMSATYALIDAQKKNITIAHVADTVACIEKPDGNMEILTEDQNCRFDEETLELLDIIAKNNRLTHRQVIQNAELYKIVKKHLAESFNKKINVVPNGCGILNGQPQLEKLMYEKEISIIPSSILTIASDGVINPYQEKGKPQEEVIRSFLNDIKNIHVGQNHEVTNRNTELLSKDPEYEIHPRLRNDDRTIIQVKFS